MILSRNCSPCRVVY